MERGSTFEANGRAADDRLDPAPFFAALEWQYPPQLPLESKTAALQQWPQLHWGANPAQLRELKQTASKSYQKINGFEKSSSHLASCMDNVFSAAEKPAICQFPRI